MHIFACQFGLLRVVVDSSLPPGNTCFVNATLQAIYTSYTPILQKYIDEHEQCSKKSNY